MYWMCGRVNTKTFVTPFGKLTENRHLKKHGEDAVSNTWKYHA